MNEKRTRVWLTILELVRLVAATLAGYFGGNGGIS